jgi:hypothetical protein
MIVTLRYHDWNSNTDWSDDDYLLPGWKNTLVALLATTDFKNYFEAEGAEIGIRYRPQNHLSVTLGVLTEELQTVPATPELWSLFGGDKLFPENYQGLTQPQRATAVAEFSDKRYSAMFLRSEISNASLAGQSVDHLNGHCLILILSFHSLADLPKPRSFTL